MNRDGLLVEVKEATQMLGWTEKKIRTRVARKTLPYRKDGKRILFLREELLQFIRDLDGVTLEQAKRNLEARKT